MEIHGYKYQKLVEKMVKEIMRKRRDLNDLNQLFLNFFSCTFFNLPYLGIYNDE